MKDLLDIATHILIVLGLWTLFALAFTAFVFFMVWIGDKLPACDCGECRLIRGMIDAHKMDK